MLNMSKRILNNSFCCYLAPHYCIKMLQNFNHTNGVTLVTFYVTPVTENFLFYYKNYKINQNCVQISCICII